MGGLRERWRGLVVEKVRGAERGLDGEESLEDGQSGGEAYRGG